MYVHEGTITSSPRSSSAPYASWSAHVPFAHVSPNPESLSSAKRSSSAAHLLAALSIPDSSTSFAAAMSLGVNPTAMNGTIDSKTGVPPLIASDPLVAVVIAQPPWAQKRGCSAHRAVPDDPCDPNRRGPSAHGREKHIPVFAPEKGNFTGPIKILTQPTGTFSAVWHVQGVDGNDDNTHTGPGTKHTRIHDSLFLSFSLAKQANELRPRESGACVLFRVPPIHPLDSAPPIIEIESVAFSEEDRFSARQIKRLIENPRAVVLVAQRDSEILGWSVALVRTHRRWRSGRIYGVAVAHSAKGQGIGRALVGSLIEHLESRSITRVYLEVRADNTPALTLYESLGFEPIAILADYYADDVHALRMRRVSEPST